MVFQLKPLFSNECDDKIISMKWSGSIPKCYAGIHLDRKKSHQNIYQDSWLNQVPLTYMSTELPLPSYSVSAVTFANFQIMEVQYLLAEILHNDRSLHLIHYCKLPCV